MPGPLAAQVAIAIGYFEAGIAGATLAGIAFVLPSFLMVVGISLVYVSYGGLWWMQALFYAIGATVIAIIAIAAYKLARSTNKRDPLLWGIFVALTVVTLWAQAELAEFFILAGVVVLLVRAWPGLKPGILMALGGIALGLLIWALEAWLRQTGAAAIPATCSCKFFYSSPKPAPLYSAAAWRSFHSCSRESSNNSAG